MEILAPAGNLEILKIAVQAGCDALYVSGKKFGARKSAPNFTNEELEIGVNYAHLRGKKVYVTVNTIVYDKEFSMLHEFLEFLVKIKVDAVIVQDLGVLYYIRKNFPSLIIHASTQMNIHNVEGTKKLINLGVKRVILARETPLEEIKKITNLNIEVEVFVHGALCYSYSGQCLMSYMIGGRSGNRGECAQPCRKNYQLKENDVIICNNTSLLSMKDLNTIEYLNLLKESGVTSLKIEGRMKSKEYVYTVVSSYYNALKGKISSNTLDKLKIAFNRKFTKGFMLKEDNMNLTNIHGVNHQGLEIGNIQIVKNDKIGIKTAEELRIGDAIRIKGKNEIGFYIKKINKDNNLYYIPGNFKVNVNDIVYKMIDSNESNLAANLLNNEKYSIDLSISLKAHYNSNLELEVSGKGIKVLIKSIFLGEICNNSLDEERIKLQLTKVGNKLFNISNINIDYDSKAFFRISDLNDIRRKAIDLWQKKYLEEYKLEQNDVFIEAENDCEKLRNICFDFVVQNKEQEAWCIDNGYNNIFKTYDNTFARHFHTDDISNRKNIIHNISDLSNDQIASPSFNIVNSYALKLVDSYNVDTIYLSNELGKNEKIELAKNIHFSNLGVLIYGHMEVMTSKHCFINKIKHMKSINCMLCKHNNYSIIDEYGNQMYVSGRCSMDGPEISIYGYKLVNELSNIKEYINSSITHFMIMLTNETIDDLNHINQIISKYKG